MDIYQLEILTKHFLKIIPLNIKHVVLSFQCLKNTNTLIMNK